MDGIQFLKGLYNFPIPLINFPHFLLAVASVSTLRLELINSIGTVGYAYGTEEDCVGRTVGTLSWATLRSSSEIGAALGSSTTFGVVDCCDDSGEDIYELGSGVTVCNTLKGDIGRIK